MTEIFHQCVVASDLHTFTAVAERRTLKRLLAIMGNTGLPLFHQLSDPLHSPLSQVQIHEVIPAQSNNSLQHFSSGQQSPPVPMSLSC